MHLSTLLILLALGAVGFGGWGLVRGVFLKGRRKKGWRDLGIGTITFVALIAVAAFVQIEEAKQAGYSTVAEHIAAKNEAAAKAKAEGDAQAAEAAAAKQAARAKEDEARLAEKAANEARKLAQEKSDAEAKLVEAKAAGFDGTEVFDRVDDLTGKAFGKQLLGFEELRDGENSARLLLRLKTLGLDGGNLDFASFANDMQRFAGEFREGNLSYQTVVVQLSVGTLDKYGNSGVDEAGTLTWLGSDLSKLQAGVPASFLLRLATDVSLGRFGRDLAVEYCKHNDLGDHRYCDG